MGCDILKASVTIMLIKNYFFVFMALPQRPWPIDPHHRPFTALHACTFLQTCVHVTCLYSEGHPVLLTIHVFVCL